MSILSIKRAAPTLPYRRVAALPRGASMRGLHQLVMCLALTRQANALVLARQLPNGRRALLRYRGGHNSGPPVRPQPPRPPAASSQEAPASVAQRCPQMQPGHGVDHDALERASGVRLPWHTWPSSVAEAAGRAVPMGLLFAPLRPIADICRLQQPPTRCSHCSAVVNPFVSVDLRARQ